MSAEEFAAFRRQLSESELAMIDRLMGKAIAIDEAERASGKLNRWMGVVSARAEQIACSHGDLRHLARTKDALWHAAAKAEAEADKLISRHRIAWQPATTIEPPTAEAQKQEDISRALIALDPKYDPDSWTDADARLFCFLQALGNADLDGAPELQAKSELFQRRVAEFSEQRSPGRNQLARQAQYDYLGDVELMAVQAGLADTAAALHARLRGAPLVLVDFYDELLPLARQALADELDGGSADELTEAETSDFCYRQLVLYAELADGAFVQALEQAKERADDWAAAPDEIELWARYAQADRDRNAEARRIVTEAGLAWAAAKLHLLLFERELPLAPLDFDLLLFEASAKLAEPFSPSEGKVTIMHEADIRAFCLVQVLHASEMDDDEQLLTQLARMNELGAAFDGPPEEAGEPGRRFRELQAASMDTIEGWLDEVGQKWMAEGLREQLFTRELDVASGG